ncbi:glucosyl-3-phosphoglycerate synthase [Pilimelia anulata]|uniref:Glucosyl-3-phosphoglycerate synthase n=1 Tax=Pilimelia anulata TaxID=53371 RepID=A0A8J3B1S5_9ACTN|nr:glucosyl-3-phosphoglycerate synthase [Pilimelia anulata]GGJ83990.1 glucosyl-3-phosphoglycerate synthase [Pilimelia anulata]
MRGVDPAGAAASWARRRTYAAGRWSAAGLAARKGGQRVSVVLPARDEQATIGAILTTVRRELMDRHGLVDELLVVDSRSTDATAEIAAAAGATVVGQDEVTSGLPRLDGKGDALWAGLAASRGDLVVFLDADLLRFRADFVTGLLGPLLTDPAVAYVKGFYHRPLRPAGGGAPEPDGGGRVTELVARPLLNLFWPELSRLVQPLSGEYAGRREVLSGVPFATGYAVETALLIDLLEYAGLDALAQVDLGERHHRHQDNRALGRMSAQILHAVWARLQRRGWADPAAEPHPLLTQFARGADEREVRTTAVTVAERPPLAATRLPWLDHHAPTR